MHRRSLDPPLRSWRGSLDGSAVEAATVHDKLGPNARLTLAFYDVHQESIALKLEFPHPLGRKHA